MSAYYNEIDPFAAAWLRELITAKLIADGEVDERSIADVRPDDLRGFRQCHFFAGIGGWSYALRLAGWPDEREVWTGSCPCQPFSSAGTQAGGHDSRDLWPVWFELIAQCRPHIVFGEQVEAAIGHGWLDRLCDDLESEDYAIGPCGLPGPCVGAYDIRQRLWFVADSNGRQPVNAELQRGGEHRLRAQDRCGDGCQADRERPESSLDDTEQQRAGRSAGSEGRAECTAPSRRQDEGRRELQALDTSTVGELGDSDHARSQGHWQSRHEPISAGREGTERRCAAAGVDGFWTACDWLPCADGKARPVEPGTFPLAHGVSARVGRLRGYGNAIKPQLAAAFIEAYLSIGASE